MSSDHKQGVDERSKDEPTGFLERRRFTLLATATLLLVLALLAVVTYSLRKRTVTPSQFEALSGLADKYYAEKDYERAIDLFKQLIPRTPASVAARLRQNLGNAYLQRGELAEAEAEYKALLDEGVRNPRLLLNLGLAVYKQGRTGEAIEYYQATIEEYEETNPPAALRAAQAIEILNQVPK